MRFVLFALLFAAETIAFFVAYSRLQHTTRITSLSKLSLQPANESDLLRETLGLAKNMEHRLSHSPVVPAVVGHRGSVHEYLENTREGFLRCAELGCSVELDVFELKDGNLVVFHGGGTDEKHGDLLDYCEVQGSILDYTLQETQNLRFNTKFAEFPCPPDRIRAGRIPTLAQVLRDLKDFPCTRIKIELKAGSPTLVSAVVELVEQLQMQDQCEYSSFDMHRLEQLCELRSSNVKSGALFAHPIPSDYLRIATKYCCTEIHLPYDACSVTRIREIHSAGFGSMAWFRGPMGMMEDLINKWKYKNEEECYAALIETGVQQICCNKPHILLDTLELSRKC